MSVKIRTEDELETYDQLTQLEHVLHRADTYVGSKEFETNEHWVLKADGTDVAFEKRPVTYVPALLKIFDEILMNAADNKIRDDTMNSIKVNIDQTSGEVSVWNNGKAVPVRLHEKEKVYIPEMVFGRLLAGSNFKDSVKRLVGGRNGMGATLTNIYSTEFSVETHDSVNKATFRQTWKANMTQPGKAKVTSVKTDKPDYIKVTFKPDWGRFGMTGMDDDAMSLFTRRVYDVAGTLPGVKVSLNGTLLKIKSFKDYVSLYLRNEGSEEKPKIVYERLHDRWHVAVALSDTGSFQHVSFVNNIATPKGGKHVDHVSEQIVSKVLDGIRKRHKGMTIKPAHVKNQLFLFVNCLIENPTFDSQSKEQMTLKVDAFGSTCPVTDDFIKKVCRIGIVESTLELLKDKEESQLKKTDGKKRNTVRGIALLEDAKNSGTKKSSQCTLFITEGNSALSFAISGIEAIPDGRDNYGAFPLRGKLLNVRDASGAQIMANAEISNLKTILGLQEKKVYTSVDELRYGSICILVDADHDGSHICSLIINWLERGWSSLLKIPGFLRQFVTPMIVCTKGKTVLPFYNQREYDEWKASLKDGSTKGWEVNYYKGLGTSTDEEAEKYFLNIDRHLKRFRDISAEDAEKLDLVFRKQRASDRKEWLKRYDEKAYLNSADSEFSISDYIDKALIHFSMYDNIRSIPSVVDGLKPGQRKIMYTTFKRNITQKIKVAQLAAEVARITEYRHGEQSLSETIIGLAQNFVGSNNINLLTPKGQFGKRIFGGKDAASPRYIFTMLEPVTRKIFRSEDDDLLDYLEEDGMSIEPRWYVPILPMVLINGAEGIGSGYSTSIPAFNPREIIQELVYRLKDPNHVFKDLTPWYRGFTGKIDVEDKVTISGAIHATGKPRVFKVTELPVMTWTNAFKEHLEKLIDAGVVKRYDNLTRKVADKGKAVKGKKRKRENDSVEVDIEKPVDFEVEFVNETTLDKAALELKLSTQRPQFQMTNMVLFDRRGALKKYNSVSEILSDFYAVRIEYYATRKAHLLRKLNVALEIVRNKLRFITQVDNKGIIVYGRSKSDICSDLATNGYYKSGGDSEAEAEAGDYDYLLKMPLYSLTKERFTQLQNEERDLQTKIADLQKKTPEDLYLDDLTDLEASLPL